MEEGREQQKADNASADVDVEELNPLWWKWNPWRACRVFNRYWEKNLVVQQSQDKAEASCLSEVEESGNYVVAAQSCDVFILCSLFLSQFGPLNFLSSHYALTSFLP